MEAFDTVSQGFGAKAAQIKWLVVVGPITTETGSVKGLICLSFPASTLVLSIELLCTLLRASPLLCLNKNNCCPTNSWPKKPEDDLTSQMNKFVFGTGTSEYSPTPYHGRRRRRAIGKFTPLRFSANSFWKRLRLVARV